MLRQLHSFFCSASKNCIAVQTCMIMPMTLQWACKFQEEWGREVLLLGNYWQLLGMPCQTQTVAQLLLEHVRECSSIANKHCQHHIGVASAVRSLYPFANTLDKVDTSCQQINLGFAPMLIIMSRPHQASGPSPTQGRMGREQAKYLSHHLGTKPA